MLSTAVPPALEATAATQILTQHCFLPSCFVNPSICIEAAVQRSQVNRWGLSLPCRSTEWLQARIVLLYRCCKWAGYAVQGAEQYARSGSAVCPSHVTLEAILGLLDDLTATWPVSMPPGELAPHLFICSRQIGGICIHAC